MNLTGKHLLRFWAAFCSDVEVLQGKFFSGESRRFEDFSRHAQEMKFLLVLNTTVGKGKFKDEHYTVMMTLMLDAVRERWLHEGKTVNTIAPENPTVTPVDDDMLALKKSIFGCYVMYSLWMNQPFIDDPLRRVLIKMDAGNIRMLRKFIEDYTDSEELEVEVKLALGGIVALLKAKQAFQFTIDSREYGVELWKRVLLTAQRSPLTTISFDMREAQDVLAHSSACKASGEMLFRMQSGKNVLKELMGQTVSREGFNTVQKQHGALSTMKVSKTMYDVNVLNEGVKEIAKHPVLTIEQLTAQETAPRIILAETRRRMQRSRKRLLEEPKAPKSPYVGQGGTFGRRKEAGDREGGERRERGMCSGNLWTYISGNTFDRPLGYLPDKNAEKAPNGEAETKQDNQPNPS